MHMKVSWQETELQPVLKKPMDVVVVLAPKVKLFLRQVGQD